MSDPARPPRRRRSIRRRRLLHERRLVPCRSADRTASRPHGYVIDNGGDEAEPNSTTPEALATRALALVDQLPDEVVDPRPRSTMAPSATRSSIVTLVGPEGRTQVQGRHRGPEVVRGRVNARERTPSYVEMRDGPRRSLPSSPTSATRDAVSKKLS